MSRCSSRCVSVSAMSDKDQTALVSAARRGRRPVLRIERARKRRGMADKKVQSYQSCADRPDESLC